MQLLNTNAHNDNECLCSQLSAYRTECYKHNFLVSFYDNWQWLALNFNYPASRQLQGAPELNKNYPKGKYMLESYDEKPTK